ncbi:G patch domain-containing protein 4 [Erpetoichthys calabaricus]|uniref:G patch domain-containing protein 4 n=1 Tax=Erpetoichthys calabaricus TaxID=27687 RepID=UPI002234E52A|nr:G patch domain-containing protein 4 [Erpetoichthys calabaricus]
MAGPEHVKSKGLKFAEEQLLKHGWVHGKGLGKKEDGMSEAIKVKVKCDKFGVGHRQEEQFTFHWWDHVFNKASSNLSVESSKDGVALKKVGEEAQLISNKKPQKAEQSRTKLYGKFLKSATLLSGAEQPEEKKGSESDDSSSSGDDDDNNLILSSTTKLTDNELMKACGGRTAHKGARHGLNMGAKLARLDEQEKEFLAKYGKNNPSFVASATNGESTPEETELKTKKKSKKKRNLNRDMESFEESQNIVSPLEEINPVKTRADRDHELEAMQSDMVLQDQLFEKKRKRNKKRKNDTDMLTLEESESANYLEEAKKIKNFEVGLNGVIEGNEQSIEGAVQLTAKDPDRKKRRKKQHHNGNDIVTLEEPESAPYPEMEAQENQECWASKKSKKKKQQLGDVLLVKVIPDIASETKKAKKKKNKKYKLKENPF